MEIIFDNVVFNNNEPININIKSNKIACFLGNDNSLGSDILKGIIAIKKPISGFINVNNNYIFKNKQTGFNSLRGDILYLGRELIDNIFLDKVIDAFEVTLNLYKVENFDLKNLLDMLELNDDILNKKFTDISVSEKISIMFLANLIKKPKIIIIDNIFGNLDNNIQKKFINLLKKIKLSSDVNIITYTNDSEVALRLSDILYIVDDEKVVISGMKYKVLKNENVLNQLNIKVPDIINFENIVYKEKNVKLGYRDEINDLIKDIYRNVK